jgi:signal transduction histidine kinase
MNPPTASAVAKAVELVHDFAPPGDDPCRRLLRQRDAWIACQQHFLGHDLPGKLVGLQGLARQLAADAGPGLDAADRDLLLHLADLARQAGEAARDLADLGRLLREAEPPSAVGLADLAAEAIAEANLLGAGRPVEYHLQQPMPVVELPPRALRRLLVQALLHAAAAAPGRQLRVVVGAREAGEGVEVWVTDDGPPLSPERRRHLTELTTGRAELFRGAPGLLLVRHLLAAWGGALRVRSGPEQGTTLTLLLRPHLCRGALS